MDQNLGLKNIEFFDIEQDIIRRFFKSSNTDYEKKFRQLIIELSNKAIKELPESIADKEFFEVYIKLCEESMAKILSKYNVYQLLYWSRRWPAVNEFGEGTELTIRLYRLVLNLGVFKYCTQNENSQSQILDNDETSTYGVINPGQLRTYKDLNKPIEEDLKQLLSDLYQCEFISFLYIRATQFYRIINKGGKLVLSNDLEFGYDIDLPKDIDYLISLYDDRLEKNNLFSDVGGFIDYKSKDLGSPILIFNLNINQKINFPILNYGTDSYKIFPTDLEVLKYFKSKFTFGPIDGNIILSYLKDYEKEFEDLYKFTIYDLLTFFSFLTYRLVSSFKIIEGQFAILQSGYYIGTNYKGLVSILDDYAVVYYKEVFKEEIKTKQFPAERIINFFKYNTGESESINLWTRGPSKIFYFINEDFFVVDFANLTEIIRFLTKDLVQRDDKIGNRRAMAFEQSVIDKTTKEFSAKKIWIKQRRIKNSMGLLKEIDSTLIIRDVLFVIEAKSKNVSFGFDKGDKRALEFREREFTEALRQVEEKVDFLISNSYELNISLPDQIRYIVPIVISPTAEYIWKKDYDLFLDRKFTIPRILTNNDLNSLKSLDLGFVKKQSYCKKLN